MVTIVTLAKWIFVTTSFCALTLNAATRAETVQAETVVRVTGGLIRGAEQSPPARGVVFKGIPFARPPIGNLRWREPQPVVGWEGTRDATHYGPACIQNPLGTGVFLAPLAKLYGHDFPLRKIDMSEDCLYLNVWTAEWPAKHAAPVMLWIHGGSNVMGSGAESSYDGATLAAKGVVVVTINYRLGIFGSFSHPQLTEESQHHASGNQGMLDQIAALQWVRDNIAQFGGDPGRVTVFGESAGSIDAGMLLCSPLASGLMQRVIMESGPVLLNHHPAALAKGEQYGEQLALSIGVNGNQAIEKLRALPTETVIEKSGAIAKTAANPGFVLDGYFLREAPGDLFAQGRELPVTFIIGNNGREISAFRANAGRGGGSVSSGLDDSAMQTVKIFYGRASSLVVASFLVDNALRRTEAADSWLNDVIGTCPGMAMASLHESHGRHAYFYLFDRQVPGRGQDSLGSFHSLEIPYVFGGLREPAWTWLPFDETDRKLSETVQDYWINFAKTGNPNGATLPEWREFDSRDQDAMEFGKGGAVGLQKRSKPTYCDLDADVLKARLTSTAR